jgi:hypothetical protein
MTESYIWCKHNMLLDGDLLDMFLYTFIVPFPLHGLGEIRCRILQIAISSQISLFTLLSLNKMSLFG